MNSWEFYEDASGAWRWKDAAVDGRVIAAATEGFETKADCLEGALGVGGTRAEARL